MQDEVNEKVVSLAIKTSKLTAEVLQKAMKAMSIMACCIGYFNTVGR